MLQLLLLFIGVTTALSIPKRMRRLAEHYPNVDPEKFHAWHQADLRFAVRTPAIAVLGAVLQTLTSFIPVSLNYLIAVVPLLIAAGWIHSLYRHAEQLKRDAGVI